MEDEKNTKCEKKINSMKAMENVLALSLQRNEVSIGR